MEALEHPSPLVAIVNMLFAPLGIHVADHLVFSALITIFILVLGLMIRSSLSVENPGKLQIVLEDIVSFLVGVLEGNMGPRGRQYLPLLGALFVFILLGNLMGQIPGLGSPTSNINVPFACAITLWLYYHWQGIRANGVFNYIKHFAVMPGVPVVMAPLIFVIEIISHLSRVLSLTLRLFGNIFGEHLVVLIIASIIPFIAPLPIQFLGLIVGPLQAFIFMTLGAIYLTAATHVDHHGDEVGGVEGAHPHAHAH
ncbi:MAG TPA: F0F1 ATP synthase subunit A [Vicinamibacterales bacterium]|nr:F0F1 ATP synthase subunit A [Vicinamibacterales bacterium]